VQQLPSTAIPLSRDILEGVCAALARSIDRERPALCCDYVTNAQPGRSQDGAK
jgi:hypothetical protein